MALPDLAQRSEAAARPRETGRDLPFTGLLALYVALWTLLPAMAFRSVPLDVAENLLWGREWPLGTYKHPPLQAWLAEAADRALGPAGIYLLSALCLAATAVCVAAVGARLVDAAAGRLAALVLLTSWYATVPVPEFNANVLQMPIWAFAAVALLRALDEDRTGWWLALGATLAAALLAKYSVVFLLAGLAAATLLHPRGLSALGRPGPWLGALLAVALAAPHLVWLVKSDFLPIAYATGRAHPLAGFSRLADPLVFLATQLLDLAPAVALLGLAGVSLRRRPVSGVLVALAIGPLLAMALYAAAAGSGLRDMWGAPAIVFLPLLAVAALTPPRHPRRLLAAWTTVTVAVPVVVAGLSWFGPALGLKPAKTAWPAAALAADLDAAWAAAVGGTPTIVAGRTWPAGLVVARHGPRTSGFVDADFSRNPWITPERVDREGVLFVWTPDETAPFAAFGPFVREGEETAPFVGGRPARLLYAIRAPRAAHPAPETK